MMSGARIVKFMRLLLKSCQRLKMNFYQRSGEAARYGLSKRSEVFKVLYFLITAIERMMLPIRLHHGKI